MRPRKVIVPLAVAALASVGVASVSQGAGKTLRGTVGPGLTISVSPSAGLKPGSYTLVVRDKSKIHNFHIIGPGVNKATSVKFVGTQSFRVRLRKGQYRFVCDPHAGVQKGSFRVK